MVQKQSNLEFEILLQLAREKTHLRQMARAIGAPHATVMRRLDKLVDENILDCQTVGKNKVFSIKKNMQARALLSMAEKYKLLELLGRYPKMGIILDDLLSTVDAPLIILFGSYAKFNAKEESDMDIYIETEDMAVKKKVERINSQLSVKIGPFDTHSPLIKEIVKNHVILRGGSEFYEKTGFFT
jgi:predicted nucleotidyltransferase